MYANLVFTRRTRCRRGRVINSLVNSSLAFSPVSSPPPDKLTVYARKAWEIISQNDPLAKGNLSQKSRRQLIFLQIKLWGKPLISISSEEKMIQTKDEK
jgi:hypothetical protein